MQQRDLGGKAGEEERLFHRRIAAADDGNLAPAEEEAVAGGATGDAVTDQRLLAGQAQPTRAGAGGDDQRAGRESRRPRSEAVMRIRAQIHRSEMGQLEGRAEAGGLLLHVVDQFRPLNALRPAGKVLHQRGHRELAAGLVALQNQGVEAGAGGVDGGGESGAAGAKNYGIASIIHRAFPTPIFWCFPAFS